MVISVGVGYDAFKVKLVDWWSLTSLSSSLLNIILGFYRYNFLTPEILLQKFPRRRARRDAWRVAQTHFNDGIMCNHRTHEDEEDADDEGPIDIGWSAGDCKAQCPDPGSVSSLSETGSAHWDR